MARVQIIDEWIRSPASPATHRRMVMVVAEKWAEQRVLMRAYSGAHDQVRPTIVLLGSELAIGPAGTDPHGPWGIHVLPPVDGHAQKLAEQLEAAARRLAGSKGNPPLLADESSRFERKTTNPWTPGTPRDQMRRTPLPMRRPSSPSGAGDRLTAHGYQSGAGAQSAVVRLGLTPAVSARLGHLANRIVPADFQVNATERAVLNRLGEQPQVSAQAIGQLVGIADPVGWMEQLISKLEAYGIELIEPGDAIGGEPTYVMRTQPRS